MLNYIYITSSLCFFCLFFSQSMLLCEFSRKAALMSEPKTTPASRARDLSGQRFGRLTAREATDQRGPDGSVLWRCVCDCGSTTLQPSSVLTGGRVTSCGCKSRENDVLRRRLDYIDGTCVQFLQNTGTLRADNTSGTRGVFPHRGKWRARITFKKKTYDLGDYARLEDAVRVRKTAEGQLFGEFLDWYHDSFPRRSGRKEENAST